MGEGDEMMMKQKKKRRVLGWGGGCWVGVKVESLDVSWVGWGMGGGRGPLSGTPSVWDGEVLEWGGAGCCMGFVF